MCKMSNKEYAVHQVTPGTHDFAVQMDGKKIKDKTQTISLNTQANAIYYLVVDQKSGVVSVKTFLTESEKETAESIIAESKQITCGE